MWSVYSALKGAVFASGWEQCISFESLFPFFQVPNTSHSVLVRHLNGGTSILFIKYLKLFPSSFSTHFLQIFYKNTAKNLLCQVWAHLNKEHRSQTFCKKGNGLEMYTLSIPAVCLLCSSCYTLPLTVWLFIFILFKFSH
jgi:hypothetical protein